MSVRIRSVDMVENAVAESPSVLARDDPDGPRSTLRLAASGEVAQPWPHDVGATDMVSSPSSALDHGAFWRTVEIVAAILRLELG
jgi:hypothetical protein